ncbi:Transcription factor A, mitochondrial [Bagarius yarrelli]|uniref:Transcription factor A, mitochondrial n=1 Tax=Bagarius yarrelli TaxID=175774 RepID=A0A556TII5_BAGYA|nr:Transcription factor A, mitochondrial [Bagarius yarrelli]
MTTELHGAQRKNNKVSVKRCSCVAPTFKNFSTATGGPPKRPLSAYLRYVKEQQPIVVRQNPEIKAVDIVRMIAQQWRTLTPEQKQASRPFEEVSIAAREQYKIDVKTYQNQLTPAQSAAIAEERRQKAEKRRAIRKKRIYTQLAEDDKVRYKNEMKAWEEHMTELGREDLVRQKESRRKKAATKSGKKKTKVKVLKAKAPAKTTEGKKTATAETKKPTSSTKK